MTNDIHAFFPHMKIDEEADRSEIGRSSWSVGLTRPEGSAAAELLVACDHIQIDPPTGSISLWSIWDEAGEKREEPLMTMALAPGSWTYFHRNDPWGMPLPVVKALNAFAGTVTEK